MRTLQLEAETWPLKTPLRDGSGVLEELDVVVVTIEQNGFRGRGEAAGVYYHGETVPSMRRQIEAVRGSIEAGATREALLEILPRGGARNAVDCALWDVEARRSSRAVWQLAGLSRTRPLSTTYTLSAEPPHDMAERAAAFPEARAIKLKLTGDSLDSERVRAVRAARPDVWLCVDANQSFTLPFLKRLMPELLAANVALIEQPLRVGDESELDGWHSPIPLAADESAQDINDLPSLLGRVEVVNIKLDKCGGLTAALAMAREATRLGLQVMVGNMAGTSLAMAPGFLVGQLCQVVDLDGPLLLRDDRPERVVYEDGTVWCPEAVWGGIAAPAV